MSRKRKESEADGAPLGVAATSDPFADNVGVDTGPMPPVAEAAGAPEGNGEPAVTGKATPVYATYTVTGRNRATGKHELIETHRNCYRWRKWWLQCSKLVNMAYDGVKVMRCRDVTHIELPNSESAVSK